MQDKELAELPKAVQDCHRLLEWMLPAIEKFPCAKRFTLGERIEIGLLQVLEYLFRDGIELLGYRVWLHKRRLRADNGYKFRQTGASRVCRKPWFFYFLVALALLTWQSLVLAKEDNEAHGTEKDPYPLLVDNSADCREQENNLAPLMRVIPPGVFWMGSPDNEKDREPDEGPLHQVVFEKGFAIGVCEVTVRQFQVFVEETGY